MIRRCSNPNPPDAGGRPAIPARTHALTARAAALTTTAPQSSPCTSRQTSGSTGTPEWITPALIAATLRVWQAYYTTALSEEDAVAILQTVGRLFGVVARGPSRESCGG